ncbi:MAG: hypothetical protein JST93_15725 [Acidobacteria bacterium]|nr:hypothetical protein [Acidobacteriota bacterium]
MKITLNAEQERLLAEAVSNGVASSLEDAIDKALQSLRTTTATAQEPKATNLSDLLIHSPFFGAKLNLERNQDPPREIDIE